MKDIKKAVEIIKKGGVIAAPTDTIYGLSCDAYNLEAVKRVFAIKGRSFNKPLIIHIGSIEELEKIAEVNNNVLKLAEKFWPGSLTLILNRREFNPAFDLIRNGLKTISVRIPNHPIALEILRQTKTPQISTSANLSDHPFPTTAQEVLEQLGDRVDMILDDGPSPIGLESTILDLTVSPPQVVRQGAVTLDSINACLNIIAN